MSTDKYEDINYIYILDYSDATICEIKIEDLSDDEKEMEIEDLIKFHGCNIDTSYWMTATDRITEILEI